MDDDTNHGTSIKRTYAKMDNGWQAAYGLELIRINREADIIGEATGKFIIPYYPTEEEFLAARQAFNRDTFLGRRSSILRITHILTFDNRVHKCGGK